MFGQGYRTEHDEAKKRKAAGGNNETFFKLAAQPLNLFELPIADFLNFPG